MTIDFNKRCNECGSLFETKKCHNCGNPVNELLGEWIPLDCPREYQGVGDDICWNCKLSLKHNCLYIIDSNKIEITLEELSKITREDGSMRAMDVRGLVVDKLNESKSHNHGGKVGK